MQNVKYFPVLDKAFLLQQYVGYKLHNKHFEPLYP